MTIYTVSESSIILQIQRETLDEQGSVVNSLRKAKVACAKLGLSEFERWVDLELKGYMELPGDALPTYRIASGRPIVISPFYGRQAILIPNEEMYDALKKANIGSSMASLEATAKNEAEGTLLFPYVGKRREALMASLGGPADAYIELSTSHIVAIISAVRDILLNWTLELEKSGVLGEGLSFKPGDERKSAEVTERVVNTFHINGNVGAFVQSATDSVVNGNVEIQLQMEKVEDLVKQIEGSRAALPPEVQMELEPSLQALRSDLSGGRSPIKIREHLQSIRTICEGATGNLIASGIVGMVAAIVGG